MAEELKNFQMAGYGERHLASLSGGQKRLVEVVKIMHAQADLALIDEPTNHMDYVAKKQLSTGSGREASDARHYPRPRCAGRDGPDC